MADTLEFDEMPIADDASLALNDMEKKQIIHALEQAKGNRKLAAALKCNNINDIPADAPPMRWTGSTVDLIELLYGLDTLKYINGGETGMGELLGHCFGSHTARKHTVKAEVRRKMPIFAETIIT